MRALKVSENKRYLVHEDGSPFFYLADTAWDLFHLLDRAQTRRYLEDRAAKGFNVIQAVGLGGVYGLRTKNRQGHVPVRNDDPTQLVEEYYQDIDWVIGLAASMGMYTGYLPTWGDKWNHCHGVGPEIFTPDNAFEHGRIIGRRFRDKSIIWILGGDRAVEERHVAVMRRMAEGLREGDGGRGLITFHPKDGHTSSENFHAEPWLDFNMWQTGHTRNRESHQLIESDWNRNEPVKPVLDGEPGYEDHPSAFNLDNAYLDDYDVRKSFYWSVFAGACGYTYGAHPIWQFWQPGVEPKSFCRTHWEDAMHLPGSAQVQHGKALVESRPYLSRVPDQTMIVSENLGGSHHVRAARDSDGSYAFIYCPFYKPVTLDLSKLSGSKLIAHWFDPRTGVSTRVGDVDRSAGGQTFQPPQGYGPDWVLVLDDASKGFGRPGER